MKQYSIMLSLVLGAAIWAQGQEVPLPSRPETDRTYRVGFRGGYNISLMKMVYRVPDRTTSYEATNGVYLGLSFHLPLGQRWALGPELDYASQGIRWHEILPLGPPIQMSETHGFINVPVLVQYATASGLIPYSGPQAGFWVIYRNYEFRSVDLAWVTGLMYVFPQGLGVDVRYNAGLLNMASEYYEVPLFSKVKNRTVQAGVVYYLARKKRSEW